MLERKELNKRFYYKLFLLLSIIMIFLTGSIFAYVVDSEKKINSFVLGDLKIELIEEKYDEYLQNLNNGNIASVEPNSVIPKDPKVKATLTNGMDSYIFLEVKNPIYAGDSSSYLYLHDDEGNLTSSKNKPENGKLFDYEINPNWELIKTENKDEYEIKIYAYVDNAGNLKALTSDNDETNTLFDNLKVANYVHFVYGNNGQDGFPNPSELQVNCYGIQSGLFDVNGIEITDKLEVFNLIENHYKD